VADQIFADGPIATPASYEVPGSAAIVPIAVQALLNGSGASGDYVPTLIFRSQAGHVIARVPTSTTVTAGDDAEVSWFPHVAAAAGASFPGLVSGVLAASNTNFKVVSGVVTTMTFDLGLSAPGSEPPIAFTNTLGVLSAFTLPNFLRVFVELTVTWPSAAYDRYIEIVPGPGGTGAVNVPVRTRGSLTPDSDRQWAFNVCFGDPFDLPPLKLNAFQASGVDRLVNSRLLVYGMPKVLGQAYV